MIGDRWHVTCGVGWTFSQNFSSLALTVCVKWCDETIWRKRITQSMNDKGVCRTAPAKQPHLGCHMSPITHHTIHIYCIWNCKFYNIFRVTVVVHFRWPKLMGYCLNYQKCVRLKLALNCLNGKFKMESITILRLGPMFVWRIGKGLSRLILVLWWPLFPGMQSAQRSFVI